MANTTTERPRRKTRIVAKRVKKRPAYDKTEGLASYDAKFLECRDLGHVWRIVGYYRHLSDIRRQLACRRCPTVSTDLWKPDGERVGRRYRYPTNYTIVGGISRYEVRVEQIHRAHIYDNEGDMIAALFSR